MPTIDIVKNTLRYSATDAALLTKASRLLTAIAQNDEAIKQDATTALNAVTRVLEHVAKERG